MSKYDIKILSQNWEFQKKRAKELMVCFTLDLSSSCYARFGTVGLTICKYKNGKWLRKVVNGWKELSFDAFLGQLNDAEWEAI